MSTRSRMFLHEVNLRRRQAASNPAGRRLVRLLFQNAVQRLLRVRRLQTAHSPDFTRKSIADVPERLRVVVHRETCADSLRSLACEERSEGTEFWTGEIQARTVSATGKVNVKLRSQSRSTSLSAHMRPPCASTIPLLMARPSPVSPTGSSMGYPRKLA